MWLSSFLGHSANDSGQETKNELQLAGWSSIYRVFAVNAFYSVYLCVEVLLPLALVCGLFI